MEKTPLLASQTSATLNSNAPVASIAVPLGTPLSGLCGSPTGATPPTRLEPVKLSGAGGHHERNETEYTWLGSILTRADSKLSPEYRKRLSKFMPSNLSPQSKLILLLCYFAVLVYTILIFAAPLVLAYRDEAQWCPLHRNHNRSIDQSNDASNQTAIHWVVRHYGVIEHVNSEAMAYGNPDYDDNPCRYIRLLPLLGLTLEECDMSRRMVVSVVLGGAIGYERRSADRPAGIRTMALVSLGSCVFTVASILAFQSSTMGWDASRVTAALPSGIGFLGGALIWKGTIREDDGQDRHQVHGLTTAASLWLSAAVGVGAGGALYVVTTYSTILVLLVLRYGPKIYDMSSYSSSSPAEEHDEEEETPAEEPQELVETAEVSMSQADDHPFGQQSEHSVRRRRRRSSSEGPTFRS